MREHTSSTRNRAMARARGATRWLIGGIVALSVAFPWAVWRANPGRHAASRSSSSAQPPVTVQLDPRLLPPDGGVGAAQDNVPAAVPLPQQQPPVVSGGS